MLSLNDNLKKRLLTIIVGAPVVIGLLYVGGWVFKTALGLAMFIALYEWFSMAKKAKRSTLISLFGLIYIVGGFVSIGLINNFEMLLILILCVWSSDSLAYVFGKMIGGPKMSPTISPNKTWAGYVGALLGAGIPLLFVEFGWFAIFIGMILGVVGQAGDLLVSALKRHVKVKDTGALFPGHGGILDRIDALLLVAPVMYAIFLITVSISGVS